MKKAQPRKKRQTSAKAARTTKSKSAAKTVHEYIAHLPEPAQTKLKQVRAAIRSVVPAETTEVVSYGIPAFKQKRVLVWYAAFADHWSLFPTAAVIEQFKDELKGYTTSKGTIQIPTGQAGSDCIDQGTGEIAGCRNLGRKRPYGQTGLSR